jgi:DNA-binding CsgD family transcriptional regulator
MFDTIRLETKAVTEAMSSERHSTGSRERTSVDGARPVSAVALSMREREVLHHVSNGLTYLQTAHRMGIAASTVDTYLRRIRAKAGVLSGAELTRLAVSLEADEPVEPVRR